VEIEFIDTPLKDAMEFLADAHHITILIDENALEEEHVNIDEPLNHTLSGIKLASAMNIILDPLKLTYILEDEVIKITSLKKMETKPISRAYQTGYLKALGIETDALKSIIQNTIQPEDWRTKRYATQVEATPGENVVILRDALGIVSGHDPRSGLTIFDAKLGKNGIEVLGDMLVVSAPKDVHDQIQGLLIQLDRRWELEHGKK
jgi:hypothetical protein